MAETKHGCRPFTIADAMILIAATAVGLAWSLSFWKLFSATIKPFDGTWAAVQQKVGEFTIPTMPCLICGTVALLIVRLRAPRPSWRRMSRQPGASASLAASLTILGTLFVTLGIVTYVVSRDGVPLGFWAMLPSVLMEFFVYFAPFVGFGVGIAWAMLGIQRRCRCETSWIDRMGRVMGVLWIVHSGIAGPFLILQFF